MLMLLIINHAGSPLHQQITSWNLRFGVWLGASVFIKQATSLHFTPLNWITRIWSAIKTHRLQETAERRKTHTSSHHLVSLLGSSWQLHQQFANYSSERLATFHWPETGGNKTTSTSEVTPQLWILQEWFVWNKVPGGWGVVGARRELWHWSWEDAVWLWVKYDIGCT